LPKDVNVNVKNIGVGKLVCLEVCLEAIEAENQNELNQNETNEAPNAEMHANKRIKNQNDVVKIMIR